MPLCLGGIFPSPSGLSLCHRPRISMGKRLWRSQWSSTWVHSRSTVLRALRGFFCWWVKSTAREFYHTEEDSSFSCTWTPWIVCVLVCSLRNRCRVHVCTYTLYMIWNDIIKYSQRTSNGCVPGCNPIHWKHFATPPVALADNEKQCMPQCLVCVTVEVTQRLIHLLESRFHLESF